MHTLAQNLHLALSDNKNLLRSSPSAITLLPRDTSSVRKRVAIRDMMASGRPLNREHAPQALRYKRRHAVGEVDPDPLRFRKLDLCSIHTIRATVYLHPRQHAQQPPGSNRHHLWRCLGRIARLRATAVVTLRCRMLSVIDVPFVSSSEVQRALDRILALKTFHEQKLIVNVLRKADSQSSPKEYG